MNRDLFARLKEENRKLVPDNGRKIKENLAFSDASERAAKPEIKTKKRPLARNVWAAVSCCLVVAAALGTALPLSLKKAAPVPHEFSVVTIDVNPVFEIKTDKDNKVVSVRALDKDAVIVAAGLPDLTGRTGAEAALEIVAAIAAEGYFSDNKTVRLLAAGANEESLNAALAYAISDYLAASLPDVTLYNGYDKNQIKKAEKYGVTLSHYLLAERAAQVSGAKIKDLVKEDFDDLLDLIYGYDDDTRNFKNEFDDSYGRLKQKYDSREKELENAFETLERDVDNLLEVVEDGGDAAAALADFILKYPDFTSGADLAAELKNYKDGKKADFENAIELLEAAFDDEADALKTKYKNEIDD